MRNNLKEKPRVFEAAKAEIKDYGVLELDAREMISIRVDGGGDCDITATDWGLYLGPSLNDRLVNNGYRAAMVMNSQGKLFVNAVCKGREKQFYNYLKEQHSHVVSWLDHTVKHDT